MASDWVIDKLAAECAIICVEEILNEQVRSDYLTETAYNEQKEYWKLVLDYLNNQPRCPK